MVALMPQERAIIPQCSTKRRTESSGRPAPFNRPSASSLLESEASNRLIVIAPPHRDRDPDETRWRHQRTGSDRAGAGDRVRLVQALPGPIRDDQDFTPESGMQQEG